MGLRRYEGAQRMLAALRPPLPLGEGWGEGAQGKQPAGYGKESHRQSCWGALTRPSATLSQRERGWVCDGTRVPSACSTALRPPLPLGEGWGEGGQGKQPAGYGKESHRQSYWEPSPGLRPPSPRGRGVGFATVRGCPAHAPPPSGPLSLWERVGVRVLKASSPPGTARNPQAELLGEPSPGLRPPSPRGRGVGFATVRGCPAHAPPPSDPLSLWERVGVRVAKASSPPGTARNRTGRAVGAPSPGLRPPSPRGRGVGFATVRGCPAHAHRPPTPSPSGRGLG